MSLRGRRRRPRQSQGRVVGSHIAHFLPDSYPLVPRLSLAWYNPGIEGLQHSLAHQGGMMETNVLYYGDNLEILRKYIPDNSIDLIYLDPPFNSKATYNVVLFG